MRKLATAALSFSAAIFLANYVFPTGWLILPAVLSAVLGAILALLRRNVHYGSGQRKHTNS